MKIYTAVPRNLLSIVLNEVDEHGVTTEQVHLLEPWIDNMMISVRSSETSEPVRRAFAHLLSRKDYDLSKFFIGGAWWDTDEEIRTFLEYTYRRGWPNAAWPIPGDEYDDVEFVKTPGPTYSVGVNRWGPDAPPSPIERRG